MKFAAAVLLILFVLYNFKKKKITTPSEKPYRWQDLPLYHYLLLLLAFFLFICLTSSMYGWRKLFLIDEVVISAIILLVLTVWNIVCNSVKSTKLSYSILGAILLLQTGFITYMIYENSAEDIEAFRGGIANCSQALDSGRKEELKQLIMKFNKSTGKVISSSTLTREFEKITASINNRKKEAQP